MKALDSIWEISAEVDRYKTVEAQRDAPAGRLYKGYVDGNGSHHIRLIVAVSQSSLATLS